jgi:hypothetical protein
MDKIIYTTVVGTIFIILWTQVRPRLGKKKEESLKSFESNLEKHGLLKYYKLIHKSTKLFLYGIIALFILVPVLFFIIVEINK